MECPRCCSHRVYRSRRGNAALVFPLSLIVVCARCHECGYKCHRLVDLLGGPALAEPPVPRSGESAAPRIVPRRRASA
jgi:hypothetical protein